MRVPDAASLASGLNDARIAVLASLYRHPAIQTIMPWWGTTTQRLARHKLTPEFFFNSSHQISGNRTLIPAEIGSRAEGCKFRPLSVIGQALLKFDCSQLYNGCLS